MATVQGLTDDSVKLSALQKSVRVRDLFYTKVADKKPVIWSKRAVGYRSTPLDISEIAQLWNLLDDYTKDNWNSWAANCALTGYNLFVQVMTYRTGNLLYGVPKLNDLYQYKVFHFNFSYSYGEFDIIQVHPDTYSLRVFRDYMGYGYRWVSVDEVWSGDLSLAFSLKTDMDWFSAPEDFYYYVFVSGIKNGVESTNLFSYPLSLVNDWTRFSRTIATGYEEVNYYEFGIRGVGCYGDLWLDNIEIVHSGQNWAFDPRCERGDYIAFAYDGIWYYPWFFSGDVDKMSADVLYLE